MSHGHDRTNGRIFKVGFGDAKRASGDLQKLSSRSLVQMQTSPNEWHARHARRILQERGPSAEANATLQALGASTVGQTAIQLRILLTQSAVGGLSDPNEIERRLADSEAIIRAWTIQLATEQGPPPAPIISRFAALARKDPSPVVRLYLASALQRLPLEIAGRLPRAWSSHAGDASDHNLPADVLVRHRAIGRSRRLARPVWRWDQIYRSSWSSWPAGSGRSARPSRWRSWSMSWAGPPSRGDARRFWPASRRLCAAGGRLRCRPPGPLFSRSCSSDPDRQVRSRALALGVTFGDPAAQRYHAAGSG